MRYSENDIEKKINECVFQGLEGIKVGDALHYCFSGALHGSSRYVKTPLKIIRNFNTRKLNIKEFGKGNILFHYSGYYLCRKDFYSWFCKVTDQADDKVVSIAGKKKITLKNYKYLKYILQWNVLLKREKMDFIDRYSILAELINSATELWEIQDYIGSSNIKLNLVTVVCDTHLTDSLIVQYFNNRNIATASLQHGWMEYTGSNPWPIEGSYSKYYLIYGEYTKKEFLKSGCPDDKLILVGMPAFIDEPFVDKLANVTEEQFGVVLSGVLSFNEDVLLLQFAEYLSEQSGLKYCVKLHPGSAKKLYDGYLDSNRISGIYETEISSIQFGMHVKFAIGGATTVFLEYACKLIPMFIYREEKDTDSFFKGINWCIFDSNDTLVMLYDKYIKGQNLDLEQQLKQTREYLSVTQNVGDKYKTFFDRF